MDNNHSQQDHASAAARHSGTLCSQCHWVDWRLGAVAVTQSHLHACSTSCSGAAPALATAQDEVATAGLPEASLAAHSASMLAAVQCLTGAGSSDVLETSDHVLESFFALAQLSDKNQDGLKALAAACAALASNPVNLEQLHATVNPACVEFGMHCLQHAALLDVATLHLLLRLGKDGSDGQIMAKARRLKQIASLYASSQESCGSLQDIIDRVSRQSIFSDLAQTATDCSSSSSSSSSEVSSVTPVVGRSSAANMPVPAALRALAGASYKVRKRLVQLFGSSQIDTSKPLFGQQLLEVLPAVLVLPDAVLVRLLTVGNRSVHSPEGVAALKQYALEYSRNCSTKYPDARTAQVYLL